MEVICQSPWRPCPSGHLLCSLPGSIHLSLRHPFGQLRRSLVMFQYPCLSVQQHQHWAYTARIGAPSWHPFSSSILRPNDSMHHPALLDSLMKTGTSFSWASPVRMMTSRRSLHPTSLRWYQRRASGWGKTLLRTSPKASPRVPVNLARLLY